MTRKSSLPCSITLFIVCSLLVTSALFNIHCSQEQLYESIVTPSSNDKTISTNDANNNKNQQQLASNLFFTSATSSTTATSFDKTVLFAQGIIENGLPNVSFKSPIDDNASNGNDRKPNPFNVATWDQKTTGGLHDEDRIKLAEIYSQAESVFEYGLGESTYIANAVNVRRYAGIDSDAAWVAMARDKVSSTYRFYFADIGPTVEWGYPANRKDVPSKAIYQYQIMPLAAEILPFDVYMVDGRYRVPCMIASFLHASARGGNPSNTIVLLHDCLRVEHYKNGTVPIPKRTNLRSYYTKADHLVEVQDHSGNRLCVYKRKPQTTDEQLLQFWQENYDMLD